MEINPMRLPRRLGESRRSKKKAKMPRRFS